MLDACYDRGTSITLVLAKRFLTDHGLRKRGGTTLLVRIRVGSICGVYDMFVLYP